MNRLSKALIANYAGQVWSAIMNIAFIPLYIRYLGIESYGLIGAFSIIMTCALVLDAGLSPMLNREMARYRASGTDGSAVTDLLRSIEIVFLMIALLLILIGYGGSGAIARSWIQNNNLPAKTMERAIFLMIVVALIRVGEGLYRGALLGLGRHVSANFLLAGLATLRSGGAVLFIVLIVPSIEGFFIWQVAVAVFGLILSAMSVYTNLGKRSRPARFSCSALRKVQRFTGAILATTLLALFLTQTDKILLVRLLPLDQFAYYALAATVAGGIYQLSGPIAQSYYPRFTQLVATGDQSELVKAYHQGAQLMSVAVIPVAATLIICSKEILTMWTGKAIAVGPTAALLPILTAGTMLHAMMYLPYMLQLASGWSSFSAWVNLVAVCFIVPAVLLLVPLYGSTGAAVAWFFLNSGYVLLSIHFMHKRLLCDEKWRWYLHDFGAPFVSVAVMGLFLMLVQPQLIGKLQNFLWVVLFVLCGFIAAALTTPATRFILASIVSQFRKRTLGLHAAKHEK